jgi:hypothetical protein
VISAGGARWPSLFQLKLEAALKKGPLPEDVTLRFWNVDEASGEFSDVIKGEGPSVLLLLLTDHLIKTIPRLTQATSTPSSSIGPRFRVVCEPLNEELAWLADFAEPIGPDQALSLLPDKDLKSAVDGIITTVSERLAAGEAPHETNANAPDNEAERSRPSRPRTQPLTRLSEFQTADSIAVVIKRATRMATRTSQASSITTSFLLFALSESTETDGPWAAHFLRETFDKLAQDYQAVRDRYFESKGVLPPDNRKGRSAAQGRSPVVMTANAFATFEKASDYARLTTGQPVIHGRHLLAALLTRGSAPQDFGVLRRLVELQVDPAQLRMAVYDWLRGYGDHDAAWAEILVGTMGVLRRLGGFTADRAGGTEDLLGIENEVQALAALIAARTVMPPLSIGLFGEWGSGKTFFMRALRSAIDGLSADARAAGRMQRELPFYKNIAQIEFNAWHYVEGNLWASLVEHILENLYKEKDPLVTRQLQEGLIRKLAAETALEQASSSAVVTAKAATESAREDLAKAQRDLDEKAKEVARLTAANVRKDFVLTGASAPVGAALAALGIPKVGDSAAELEASLRHIHTVLGRGQRFLIPLMQGQHRGRRFVWLALTLLGAPAVAVIINLMMGEMPRAEIYAYASGIATLISAGAAWLKHQADWMSERLAEAEKAQRAFDAEMTMATAAHVAKVTEAEQKLSELMSAFEAAQRNHADAKGRQAAATAELEAATTGRLLANFITDRAASSDYRKHLGILALVRDDFEKLSGLIEEENWRLSPLESTEVSRGEGLKRFVDLTEEEKDRDRRINRIVLYIDDLDRCPPNKVVDVLQAVHLLLAFPLFVVVVGVDARWVTKSLETRYRELLRLEAKTADGNGGLLVGAATPNDYLEKIFQIPFWLKPMDSRACENMVSGLLRLSVARGGPPETGGNDQSTSGGTQSADSGTDLSPAQPNGAPQDPLAGSSPHRPSESASLAPGAGEPTPKAQPPVLDLTISQEELEYMRRLSGVLGRSPRALKRFVNVYRLIKAGLEEHELQAFTRQRPPVADYQAVLFLLAVDTGAPLAARAFFELVDAGAASDEPASLNWLVNELDKRLTLSGVPDWQRLRLWLTTQREVVPKDADLSLLGAWTRRVGRYSFEVGRS